MSTAARASARTPNIGQHVASTPRAGRFLGFGGVTSDQLPQTPARCRPKIRKNVTENRPDARPHANFSKSTYNGNR
jgi:hypothetical protein